MTKYHVTLEFDFDAPDNDEVQKVANNIERALWKDNIIPTVARDSFELANPNDDGTAVAYLAATFPISGMLELEGAERGWKLTHLHSRAEETA